MTEELELYTVFAVWWGGQYQGMVRPGEWDLFLERLEEEHPEVVDVLSELMLSTSPAPSIRLAASKGELAPGSAAPRGSRGVGGVGP